MPINSLIFTEQKLEPYCNPEQCIVLPVKIAASQTLVKGTVIGRITASNLWIAYATGASDGSETARAILMHDVVTDAGGLHYFGQQASSEHGEAHTHVPAYFTGTFRDADLTGLDAAGLAEMGGRLFYGDDLSDANAIVHIP